MLDAEGKIYWSPNGNPKRKVYLDENSGVSVQDIWLDYRDAHNQNIKITGYPRVSKHRPIKNFSLIADVKCGRDIEPVVDEWMEHQR